MLLPREHPPPTAGNSLATGRAQGNTRPTPIGPDGTGVPPGGRDPSIRRYDPDSNVFPGQFLEETARTPLAFWPIDS